ncbi:deoxyribodipyrimidine photo-lyase [Candidatus Woesebacteria bacterium]|nr:deoxyribodipyrimidine photo-lyase [Candidatus Woesebacteria bacterium]
MQLNRTKLLNDSPIKKSGSIVYWMIRDQRAVDNWALTHAQSVAVSLEMPLHVVVIIRKNLKEAHGTSRMMEFMLKGLQETATALQQKNISFDLLLGDPVTTLMAHCEKIGAAAVVTDLYPLPIYTQWQHAASEQLSIPLTLVDAHNCVPVWQASSKKEYSARTFRPRITSQLAHYTQILPQTNNHPYGKGLDHTNWQFITKNVEVDTTVSATTEIVPGTNAGYALAHNFITHTLPDYLQKKNDPNQLGCSGLSPYLHFGQISAQRVLFLLNQLPDSESKLNFIEELVVRRELADNFCYYSESITTLAALPQWAQHTLQKHLADPREYTYALNQFETAQTHDALWNAAQMQLLKNGKMHGYMRMYWAKKILEWSNHPQDALDTAIYLNDHYSLDGRDPNGYVGILWSIGGLHDRPWFEKPIFGLVRTMTANGLSKKFDTHQYCAQWT